MPVLSITNAAPKDAFPANLNTRTKIIICFFCSLAAIILSGLNLMGILALVSCFYALATKKIKGILIAYLGMSFMFGMSVFFVFIMMKIFPQFVGNIEAKRVVLPFFRIVLMTNAVLVLALTSRIQLVLKTLKNMRLPGVIFIPAAVMIRFIPAFLNDFGQIRQTLKIRGYSIGVKAFLLHPVATGRLLVAPLVFRALRSADDLAVAAELKGIQPKNTITVWEEDPMQARDWWTLAVFFCLLIGIFYLQAQQGFSFGGH